MTEVEFSQCVQLDVYIIELLNLSCSLTQCKVNPFMEAGVTEQVLFSLSRAYDLSWSSRALVTNDEVAKVRRILALKTIDHFTKCSTLNA